MEKKTYHHKDLKNALIENGIQLVAAEGIEKFSLRKAAAACGVSHAAPYSHFSNKDDLLNAMQQHITDQFSLLLEQTRAQHEKDPDLLMYMGKAYIMFFLDHPHYFSFLFSQTDLKIDLSADSPDSDNFRPFVIFKDAVYSFPAYSALSKQEKNDFVIALWAVVHGIASIATMKHVVYETDWELKIEDILKTFKKIEGSRT